MQKVIALPPPPPPQHQLWLGGSGSVSKMFKLLRYKVLCVFGKVLTYQQPCTQTGFVFLSSLYLKRDSNTIPFIQWYSPFNPTAFRKAKIVYFIKRGSDKVSIYSAVSLKEIGTKVVTVSD